jgi:23S rRNA pseudouridine2457 synthase
MTAAIGYPTLRLIRVRIANLKLNGLQAGEVNELSQTDIYRLTGFDKFISVLKSV